VINYHVTCRVAIVTRLFVTNDIIHNSYTYTKKWNITQLKGLTSKEPSGPL